MYNKNDLKKMAANALHEIFTTNIWCFLPSALQAYRKIVEENVTTRSRLAGGKEDEEERPFLLSSSSRFSRPVYVTDADELCYGDFSENERVISVLRISGPILRNSGACSYGSLRHKEWMLNAADCRNVIGHLLIIDSPGGSYYSMFDYEDAIGYAREKGQPVIAFVKGMAASCAYAAAMMCDEVYTFGLHANVGCIGTMIAGYLHKSGDVNSVTQERYVELYAEGSPYKNRGSRDAAEGNYDRWMEMLNESCAQFHARVRKYRPQVTEEQMKGETYDSGDVIGTLVDGEGSVQSCVDRIIELSETQELNKNNSRTGEKNGTTSSAVSPSGIQNQTNMKEYPKIQSALGVEALVSDRQNGLYLNEELAGTLESHLSGAEQTEENLNAKMQEISLLNSKIEQMKKEHTETLERMKSEHDEETERLNASHREETSRLSAELEAARASLAAKEAEIAELSRSAGQPPAPHTPPKGNSLESGEQGFAVKSVVQEGMTMEEKQKAVKERMKELERRRFS